MVWCPLLCGRGATSFTSTFPSLVKTILRPANPQCRVFRPPWLQSEWLLFQHFFWCLPDWIKLNEVCFRIKFAFNHRKTFYFSAFAAGHNYAEFLVKVNEPFKVHLARQRPRLIGRDQPDGLHRGHRKPPRLNFWKKGKKSLYLLICDLCSTGKKSGLGMLFRW